MSLIPRRGRSDGKSSFKCLHKVLTILLLQIADCNALIVAKLARQDYPLAW